jgi:hypothetical protein
MKQLSTPKRIWIPLLVGISAVIGATNASALPVSAKPSKPAVQSIRASAKSSKGTVDVSVTFSIASTNVKSPILLTQVKVGTKICTANRTAAKCTVKAVVSGKTYKVLARAKNRNGFGAWSSGISFGTKSRSTWSRTSNSTPSIVTTAPTTATTTPNIATTTPVTATTTPITTSTLPVLRTDLSKANVLGISTVKLAKVGGISSSGVQSTRVRKYAVGDVIFKTSGIVAYAQADTSSQSGSKLLAVSTTGAVSDAISSGTAVVKDFYSAPNGNVYIVFESKVALTTGGTTCLLAVVDVSTGAPTCVDSTLDSVKWGLGSNGDGNSPIQIDTSGAVYYAGQVGSTSVLRKAKNGAVTDLINDNVTLRDFLVQPDGMVFVSGSTTSSSVHWLRRISTSGGLKNLAITYVLSLWKFADGKVYAGAFLDSMYGVKRYSADLDALEDKSWISGNINGVSRDAHFLVGGNDSISDCGSENYSKNLSFCGSYGSSVAPVFNILGQKTFGVARGINPRQLWQYYPTVEKTNVTAISSVTLAQQVITMMILSGTSSSGSNILSLYDTSSKQETVVMDGSNEVEIYSMSYSQKKNAIMFSGLRFSDNKYVVGEVSLG